MFAYSNETYESKDWIRHLGLIKDQTNKTGFKFQRGPRGHGILAPFSEIESKDEKHNLKFWYCLQRFFFTSPRPFMMMIQYPKLYPPFSCVHECLSSLKIYLFLLSENGIFDFMARCFLIHFYYNKNKTCKKKKKIKNI